MNDEKAQATETPDSAASALSAGLCRTAFALYRPPFIFDHGYIFDADSRIVADSEGQDVMLRVRGWGRISYLPTPEKLQDKVGELIADALTEYWTRHSAKVGAGDTANLTQKIRSAQIQAGEDAVIADLRSMGL